MLTRFIILIVLSGVYSLQAQDIYSTSKGTISFRSEAPLEIIRARSEDMGGRIDASKRTFAFQVAVRSFEGFNSGLQQIHFNENYLESDKYPEASFSGKIIEPVDFTKPGKTSVRAKGILRIHGVEQE